MISKLHSVPLATAPCHAHTSVIHASSTDRHTNMCHHFMRLRKVRNTADGISTMAQRDAARGSSSSTKNTAHMRQQQPDEVGLLQQALANPPRWQSFVGSLAASGAVFGTLLDGIHSRVGLQVYDLAPVTAGPLTTSLLVPPLLATFYVVLGLLSCTADNLTAATPATRQALQRTSSGGDALPYIAACFGALALNLYVSASLFDAGVAPSTIFAVLALLATANWAVFDCTVQGLGLAVLCGVGAPAAELVLMSLTGCWHYSRPDVAAVFVRWVPLCYVFYVPAVSNMARYLWRSCKS